MFFKKIVIIGSGNLATHLATHLFEKGGSVVQIYSPTLAHAQALGNAVNAQATDDLLQLLPADVYLISVTDAAIREVIKNLHVGNALVVHTSGSTNKNILAKFPLHGVLYPLQTFSKQRLNINWEVLPFFIEANNSEALKKLKEFALLLSPNVQEADSEQRLKLHTAAVFACNFVNYLLGVAADLSQNYFPLLQPLANETIEKAFDAKHPREVQTGPALRNDTSTMETQLQLLSPEWQALYRQLSELIQKQKQENE